MRGARLLLPCACVLGVATLASATAPPDQYGFYDQTSQTITDAKTLLTWQRCAPGMLGCGNTRFATVDFYGAAAYCAALSPYMGMPWRVPSYKELETLVDEYPHVEYVSGAPVTVYVDGNAFLGTPTDQPFWTSSANANGYAYTVLFKDASSSLQTTNESYYVRCVTP